MDLEAFVPIAEIVSSIAVALTLIVLLVSIRQNTRSQRALAVDSLAGAIATINVPAIESERVGNAMAKATADWSTASREERIAAHYFLFSYFKLAENAWYQQKTGILDREQWLGWEATLRQYYHSKGVREVWWPNRRNAYSKKFQEFLLETSPPELGTLGNIFDSASSDSG